VKKPAATPVKGVPLPRPRPAEEELHAQAYSPDASAPPLDAIGEAIRLTPPAAAATP
jgi:hypothetical protein